MELCFLCMENKTKSVSIGGLLRHLNINPESVPVLSESACSKDLNGGNEIKVELCEACEMINKRFSVLFRQLLKVQLEMDYLLKKIRSCLIAGDDGNFMAKGSKMKSEKGQAWIASMDNLRKEITEQCLKKQSGPVPCIKLSKVKLKHNEAIIIKEEIEEEALEELQEVSFDDNFAADTFADSPLYFISSTSQVPEVKSVPVVLSTASEEAGKGLQGQNEEVMEEENIQDTETTQPVPPIITGTSFPSECPPKSPPQAPESTTAPVEQLKPQQASSEVTSQQEIVEDSQIPMETPEIKMKPKECHSKDPVTRLYHCKICNKTSPNSVTIVRHYEREHLQKRLKCDICNKAVATRSDHLAVHKKSCRQNLEKLLEKKKDPKYKFPCDLCQQRFTSRHFLDTHRLHVHVSIGRFVCELCGKKFKRLTHLKAHNDGVHLGVKYSCKFCEVSYACKYQIRRHEKACSKNTNKK